MVGEANDREGIGAAMVSTISDGEATHQEPPASISSNPLLNWEE